MRGELLDVAGEAEGGTGVGSDQERGHAGGVVDIMAGSAFHLIGTGAVELDAIAEVAAGGIGRQLAIRGDQAAL